MKKHFEVTRYRMTRDDAHKIIDALRYGTRRAAEKLYEFTSPVYDEDAGVYTEYGQNDPNRTFAQVHFRNLCDNAIVGVEWNTADDDPTYVTLLDIAVPAVSQLLWAIWSDTELQDSILNARISSEWASDGHYGSKSREEFSAELTAIWRLDRTQGRRLCDLLGTEYNRDVVRKQYGTLIIDGGK